MNQYKFYAFALESYGGLSEDATRLLQMIAAHSTEMTPKEYYLHALKRLSVVLQKANANISLIGQQLLHEAQHHQLSKKRFPAFRYHLGQGHSHPQSSVQLTKKCDPGSIVNIVTMN